MSAVDFSNAVSSGSMLHSAAIRGSRSRGSEVGECFSFERKFSLSTNWRRSCLDAKAQHSAGTCGDLIL